MKSVGVEAFLFALGVAIFVYGGVGLVLFCLRMDRWPIRQRLPMEMLAGSLFAWIFALSLYATNEYYDRVPFFWSAFLPTFFMVLAADTFTIAALTLWLMFNRTQSQLKIVQAMDKADSVVTDAPKLTIAHGLLDRRPRIAYVVVNAIVYAIVEFWYASRYPGLFTALNDNTYADPTSPASTLVNIGVYKMGVSMVLIIILSYRMRIVSDSLGIKRCLKQIGLCSLVGVVMYAFAIRPITSATGHMVSVNTVVGIVCCTALLTFSIHIPLWHSYSQPPVALDGATDDIGLFERFLSTPAGFEAFRKQLELEFSLENLLFWKAVQDYRRTFVENSLKSAAMACHIFRQYLAPYAPFELNLDGDPTCQFGNVFTPGCTEGDLIQRGMLVKGLFDKASTVVLSLMFTNTLGRFRVANPGAWNSFIDTVKEDAILAQFESSNTSTILVKPRPQGDKRTSTSIAF